MLLSLLAGMRAGEIATLLIQSFVDVAGNNQGEEAGAELEGTRHAVSWPSPTVVAVFMAD